MNFSRLSHRVISVAIPSAASMPATSSQSLTESSRWRILSFDFIDPSLVIVLTRLALPRQLSPHQLHHLFLRRRLVHDCPKHSQRPDGRKKLVEIDRLHHK